MDSRAKQRLTGAVILVALFVLLVPELLTGPHGADAPGTAAEEGMRRYTIDLNANNPASLPETPATAPVALPQPESPKPTPTPTREQPLAQPGEAAAPAIVTETQPTSPPPAAVGGPAKPAPATAATPPAAKPASSPAPRAEPPKPTVAPGSFAVQLGSFGVRDNADRLVRDMTAKGFAAFVAPIKSGGREIYRVRVGPTRDRAQAEALAAQLRRIGQSGAIVPIT
jgi:DedD protein